MKRHLFVRPFRKADKYGRSKKPLKMELKRLLFQHEMAGIVGVNNHLFVGLRSRVQDGGV